MAIKKAFEAAHSLLVANKDKKVSDLLPRLEEMWSAQQARGAGHIADAKGLTVAVMDTFDGYWKALVGDKAVEVAKRPGSASGYNTMSKASMSPYGKRLAAVNKAIEDNENAQKANNELSMDLANGKIKPEEFKAKHVKLLDVEKVRADNTPKESTDGANGFKDRDAVVAYLAKNGVKL